MNQQNMNYGFYCSRLCTGNNADLCSASSNNKFSAERNVAECQFPGYTSWDAQTYQTSLSPKRAVLCHQTGNSHIHSKQVDSRYSFKKFSTLPHATYVPILCTLAYMPIRTLAATCQRPAR